ncbi:hypothetical protein FEM48_Zijuj01G0260700 [Ziziphus jujuba var. spinosa]|uniref:Subtilisin-like protease SBT1.5 n=1 Tax=Ziziphus jujuba var. spinosa TaxID=714518 RepID=A0A978W4W7_ZIZJJ|nr:hypothetical protein FEM48_Zijuj01G0260700 [Ziziphus jujuba var. spinosa]
MASSSSLLVFFFFTFAASSFASSSTSSSSAGRKTFIVQVQRDAKPSIFPTHKHWYESSLASLISSTTNSTNSDPATVIHTYETVFHGFSAKLSPLEVQKLHSLPHVVAVIPEQVRHLQTTRSPEFLGLKTTDSAGLLKESDFGSDLVIGVIDTGIWPERQSFNDHDLGPIPSKWKGQCVAGNGFPANSCNRKLIGARFFCNGYESTNGKMNETTEYRSPRDSDGHGSHTASIAAGRYVFPASTLGYARGVAAGMAPKARLAAYKVCWNAGCYDSDILAAFDAAVADGVDVVSLSVGGAVVPYYLDSIAIAAFGATDAGVFVSASAGNGGPGGLTVTNVAPWVTTVGAGTIDRDFPADVKLGNGRTIPGVSIYGGPGLTPRRMYPLVYGGNEGGDGYSSSLCLEGSLDQNMVKGKIVLCDRGINSRAAKGEVVKKAGGIGMILANGVFDGEGLVADCHVLPATAVGASSGDELRRYITAASKSTSPPTATIIFKGTKLGIQPAPVVASGGTMLDESTGNVSTVMDFGAGHVHPQKAMDPGLVYDISSFDYVDFLCNSNYTTKNIQAVTRKSADCSGAKKAGHSGNLNYPSLSVVFQQYGKEKMSTHFIRTVTNVGDPNSVYHVTVRPPRGMTATVQPEKLAFRRIGQKLSFLVRVQARAMKLSAGSSSTKSGSVVWSDGKHTVTSPLVVTMQRPL